MYTHDYITKLELALKLMQDRKHDVAGLGAPISIIKDVLEDLRIRIKDNPNSDHQLHYTV